MIMTTYLKKRLNIGKILAKADEAIRVSTPDKNISVNKQQLITDLTAILALLNSSDTQTIELRKNTSENTVFRAKELYRYYIETPAVKNSKIISYCEINDIDKKVKLYENLVAKEYGKNKKLLAQKNLENVKRAKKIIFIYR